MSCVCSNMVRSLLSLLLTHPDVRHRVVSQVMAQEGQLLPEASQHGRTSHVPPEAL